MEDLQLQITNLQNQINNLPIQNKQKYSNTTINTTETVVQRGGMQSAEFSTGATGWRFDADGNLEANSGHFRGDVTGASGTFSGVLTGGSLNIPDITSAPSFHVDNTGNTWWGAAAIGGAVAKITNAGALTATGVTVTGALTTGAGSSINGTYLTALSVTAAKIAAGTITADKIAAGTITSNEILTNTLTVGTNVGIGTAQTAAQVTTIVGNTVTTGFVNALNITATSISGGIIDIGGADTTSFHIDIAGNMWLGAATYNIATNPFAVSNAGVLKAQSGTIGGTTITDTTLYGGIIQTSAIVGAGNNGVIMDTAGLRGYDSVLGKVFDIHTDGSAPEFAFGNISNSVFEINTNAILRTSATVGDGSASSAGILINDTGLYATEANQTLANANVKILIDGSAVIKMNVKGGQTDYNTGTGYFLGLSGGDYKLSLGSPASNYLTWDGTFLKMKGSLDVGIDGLINNAVYTNANLPVPATVVGWVVPSSYE